MPERDDNVVYVDGSTNTHDNITDDAFVGNSHVHIFVASDVHVGTFAERSWTTFCNAVFQHEYKKPLRWDELIEFKGQRQKAEKNLCSVLRKILEAKKNDKI